MYGHTTWPPPCGTTGAGTGAPTGADPRTGTVPARTGRWNR